NVSDEINIVKDSYLNLEMEINTLNSQEEIFSYELQKISNEIEKLQQEQLEVKKEFRKKGGILAEERETLNSRIAELEGKRFIINQNIKEFCNDILPFLIVKKQISNLEKQLKTENDILLYSRLKDKLNIEYIKNLLSDKIMPSALDEIALTVSEALTEDIKPDSYEENFKSIHNLSDDESRKLLSLINTILNFDNNSIINSFEEHRSISNELADIRHKLNTSLKDESLNTYINDMSNLSSKIDSLLGSKNLLVTSLDKLKLEIAETKSRRDKSKAKYIYLLQHNNIVDISTNLILMLDEIVTTLTETKIKLIQDNFMYIFKKIIQKDNFISHIDINVNFDISLYINKIYNSLELENLAKNIGIEGMEKKLGKLFFDDLFNLYSVEDKYELFNVIRNNTQSTFLNLRTKVDIDEFSSGEKQIYVLCLYWALLKSSGIEIPFIIDTPYARIDDTHRNSITSEYFSTISHQIIILSTNTEIDEKLYKIIKPKLSREYLLEYDSKNKKTIQNKGYFFEV
ncbi:TPA: DNA sulfur modification protein DndD, partial [Clostridioides difficile]|nr:DNA sulfur modification protein DndD [Clostridioides difficile]